MIRMRERLVRFAGAPAAANSSQEVLRTPLRPQGRAHPRGHLDTAPRCPPGSQASAGTAGPGGWPPARRDVVVAGSERAVSGLPYRADLGPDVKSTPEASPEAGGCTRRLPGLFGLPVQLLPDQFTTLLQNLQCALALGPVSAPPYLGDSVPYVGRRP